MKIIIIRHIEGDADSIIAAIRAEELDEWLAKRKARLSQMYDTQDPGGCRKVNELTEFWQNGGHLVKIETEVL